MFRPRIPGFAIGDACGKCFSLSGVAIRGYRIAQCARVPNSVRRRDDRTMEAARHNRVMSRVTRKMHAREQLCQAEELDAPRQSLLVRAAKPKAWDHLHQNRRNNKALTPVAR